MKKNNIYLSFLKPFIDTIISFLLIILLIPFFVFIYLFILTSTFHNPIFCQKRVGKRGKIFTIYKFRTMKFNAKHYYKSIDSYDEKNNFEFYARFFRSTHIDETPQLFNILFQQMAFVGPRPHIDCHAELLELRSKSKVFELRPGLTGLAQINERDHIFSDREKFYYDLEYSNNINFKSDLKITFGTFPFIVRLIKKWKIDK